MNLNKISDEQIVYNLQKIKNFNTPAFELYFDELFNRYKNQIYCLCRYYGLQHEDSLDVIQETFIRLIKFLKSFKKNSTFKPWFFKIVLNLVRNKYHEINKNKFIAIEELSSDLPFDEENFEKIQNKEYILGILNRIPTKFKEVILLNVYGEMSLEEVSIALNISLRQVYNRQKKGYELIKEIVGAMNERGKNGL